MKFSIDNIRKLPSLIRELSVGLYKLSFLDNFEGFKTTVTILPSTTLPIRNELSFIPTERIILRQDKEAAISDSSTSWSKDFVYLENHDATNTVILTVFFMR